MSALFNLAAGLIREISVVTYERRAAQRKTLIVLCAFCSGFMTEQPSEDGKGKIERSLCAACVSVTSEKVN